MKAIHQKLILNYTLINTTTEDPKTYVKKLSTKLEIFSSVENFGIDLMSKISLMAVNHTSHSVIECANLKLAFLAH